MIDLHSHVLPGLDDGPGGLEGSLALARTAARAGTTVLAATPHIRHDHPVSPASLPGHVDRLNAELAAAGVELSVIAGGEVSLSKVVDLDDETLRGLCLGEGPSVLIESPHGAAPEMLDRVLFDLQVRGFRPVLAHPERSPAFAADPKRLRALVGRGVLCSITAGSMEGAFGRSVRSFTRELFEEGLVHDVASDAHDDRGRPPLLLPGFASLDAELPGLAAQADWFLRLAPAAILAGEELPPRPDPPSRTRRWPLGGRARRRAPERTARTGAGTGGAQ